MRTFYNLSGYKFMLNDKLFFIIKFKSCILYLRIQCLFLEYLVRKLLKSKVCASRRYR